MIGNRIREVRKNKGISLSKLAQISGISKSYLSYVERNLKKNPSVDIVKKISIALDITVESLLAENDREMIVDEEWLVLVRKAIALGVSKERFREFLQYWKSLSK